jgi:hypothetical protein
MWGRVRSAKVEVFSEGRLRCICGLVLVGVVAVVNGKHLRTVFAGR